MKTGTGLAWSVGSPTCADWLPVQTTITGFVVEAAAFTIFATRPSSPCVATTQPSWPWSAISVSRIGANDGLLAYPVMSAGLAADPRWPSTASSPSRVCSANGGTSRPSTPS